MNIELLNQELAAAQNNIGLFEQQTAALRQQLDQVTANLNANRGAALQLDRLLKIAKGEVPDPTAKPAQTQATLPGLDPA